MCVEVQKTTTAEEKIVFATNDALPPQINDVELHKPSSFQFALVM
jgi:hypothetical protein